MEPYRGFSVFPLLLHISFGAPTEDLSANSFKISVTDYRSQVTGAGTGTDTGLGFFITGTQRHDALQEKGTCIHYVDPCVMSHAYGLLEPQ